jgi:hypothetical protein
VSEPSGFKELQTDQSHSAVPMNYLMWIMVGFAFSKVIRSRFRGWWLQYNYILSAALDAGLALSTIFIFLTLQLTSAKQPNWWGNNVVSSTLVCTNAKTSTKKKQDH